MANKYANRIADCVVKNIEQTDYCITLKNFCLWGSEFDVLHLDGDDYLYEYEIKTSVSDYKADFNKLTSTGKNKHLQTKNGRVNYFYFVFPYNLISEDEVPSYCGVIYYTGNSIEIIRKAPLLTQRTSPNRAELSVYMADKINSLCKKLKYRK